jgi:hypothetical protein
MLDSATAANVAVDLDVIRRVREHRSRFLISHEQFVGHRIERAAAIDAMLAKQPQVAGAGHRRSNGVTEFIRPVRVIRRIERLDAQINGISNPMASKIEVERQL